MNLDSQLIPLPPSVVWGTVFVYIVAWLLLMWPHHLPLGRPGIALVFAALACELREACRAFWPDQKYESIDILGKVHPTPIMLLFGLMLVNSYLKDAGFWRRMQIWLDAPTPRLLLFKVCVCSASMSAFLLNDTTCFILPSIVMDICAKHRARSVVPYLIAISTSANLGSSLTPIGNPQNALIVSIFPHIGFLPFMQYTCFPVITGLIINTTVIWLSFRRDLAFEDAGKASGHAHVERPQALSQKRDKPELGQGAPCTCIGWHVYMLCTILIVAVTLVSWFGGLAIDYVSLASGIGLMFVRSVFRRCYQPGGDKTETETNLCAIDYPLLLLFAAQFVLVGATVDTGLPQEMFRHMLGPCTASVVANPVCIVWFSGFVISLSNIISNVPVILMLEPMLASQPIGTGIQVWMICAWAATAAGNLTMLGSAANLIVANEAETRGEMGYTAMSHGKVAFAPTLVITILGIFLMPPLAQWWSWMVPVIVASVCSILVHPEGPCRGLLNASRGLSAWARAGAKPEPV